MIMIDSCGVEVRSVHRVVLTWKLQEYIKIDGKTLDLFKPERRLRLFLYI